MIVCFLSLIFTVITANNGDGPLPHRLGHGNFVGFPTGNHLPSQLHQQLGRRSSLQPASHALAATGEASHNSDPFSVGPIEPKTFEKGGKTFFIVPPELKEICQALEEHFASQWAACKKEGWCIVQQNLETNEIEYAFRVDAINAVAKSLKELSQIPDTLYRRSCIVMILSGIAIFGQTVLSLVQPDATVRLPIGITTLLLTLGCSMRDFWDYETIIRQQEERRANLEAYFLICRAFNKQETKPKELEEMYTLAQQQQWIFKPPQYDNTTLVVFGNNAEIISSTSGGDFEIDPVKAASLSFLLNERIGKWETGLNLIRYVSLLSGFLTIGCNITWLVLAGHSEQNPILTRLLLPSHNSTNTTSFLPQNDDDPSSVAFFIFTICSPVITFITALVRFIQWHVNDKITTIQSKLLKIFQLKQVLTTPDKTALATKPSVELDTLTSISPRLAALGNPTDPDHEIFTGRSKIGSTT